MFHHPGIQEVCVIGVSDSYRGETVKAVVVRKRAWDELTEQKHHRLDASAGQRVQGAPHVEFVEALPKNASGKVMWRQLQDAELSRSASSPAEK